jgi:hypothetical protein
MNAVIEAKPTAIAAQAQSTTPSMLLQLAMEQGADLDRLERLMDMQIRWEERQARNAFVAAMAAFKNEPMTIYKDRHVNYANKNGDITDYMHASLGGVVAVVVPALARHGLSHRWETQQGSAGITVTCAITHSLGHSESISLSSPPDQSGGKNSIQAIGSTVSYLQRYTLLAITGLATSDMDDDGRQLNEGAAPEQSGQEPAADAYPDAKLDAQIDGWSDLIAKGKTSPEHIISKISSSFSLTDAQKARIHALAAKKE